MLAIGRNDTFPAPKPGSPETCRGSVERPGPHRKQAPKKTGLRKRPNTCPRTQVDRDCARGPAAMPGRCETTESSPVLALPGNPYILPARPSRTSLLLRFAICAKLCCHNIAPANPSRPDDFAQTSGRLLRLPSPDYVSEMATWPADAGYHVADGHAHARIWWCSTAQRTCFANPPPTQARISLDGVRAGRSEHPAHWAAKWIAYHSFCKSCISRPGAVSACIGCGN